MMRKLAIASLLVAGVALSGSVFAQAASSAPAASSSPKAAHSTSATKHKTHKKAAKKTAPASGSSAG